MIVHNTGLCVLRNFFAPDSSVNGSPPLSKEFSAKEKIKGQSQKVLLYNKKHCTFFLL